MLRQTRGQEALQRVAVAGGRVVVRAAASVRSARSVERVHAARPVLPRIDVVLTGRPISREPAVALGTSEYQSIDDVYRQEW